MKRKLLLPERVLYGDGNRLFNGVFAVKIRGQIEPGNLYAALEGLQAKHPLLKTGITADEQQVPWFVTAEVKRSIPVRLVERQTEEDWAEQTKKELATPFDMRNGPLCRVVWIRGAEVSDLLITIHHCMCDGTTTATLMHELLLLLDQPDKDLGKEVVFESIGQLIPAAIRDNKKNIRKARLSAAVIRTVLSCITRIMPKNKPLIRREDDFLLHWKLGREASSALLRRCVTAHVTPHTALCVAFLQAFAQVRGSRAHGKISCPIDIRRLVKEIKRDTVFSFGMAVNLALDKQPGGFWDKAARMQVNMLKLVDKLQPYEQLMQFEYLHASAGLMATYLTHAKPKEDLMLSNMGRMDLPKNFGSFEVEDIYSPAAIGPFGSPCTVMSVTFRGQMNFSFISNTAVMAYEEAERIKNIAMEILLAQITVPVAEPA
jgi:NRPS condensation-like uncharacterized protein